jgi:hypothetical protein
LRQTRAHPNPVHDQEARSRPEVDCNLSAGVTPVQLWHLCPPLVSCCPLLRLWPFDHAARVQERRLICLLTASKQQLSARVLENRFANTGNVNRRLVDCTANERAALCYLQEAACSGKKRSRRGASIDQHSSGGVLPRRTTHRMFDGRTDFWCCISILKFCAPTRLRSLFLCRRPAPSPGLLGPEQHRQRQHAANRRGAGPGQDAFSRQGGQLSQPTWPSPLSPQQAAEPAERRPRKAVAGCVHRAGGLGH